MNLISGLMNCNAPRAFIKIDMVSYFQFDRMFLFGMIAFLVMMSCIKIVIRISPGNLSQLMRL